MLNDLVLSQKRRVMTTVWSVRMEERAWTSSAAYVQTASQVPDTPSRIKEAWPFRYQERCGIFAGVFCEKSICLKDNSCLDDTRGFTTSLSSQLYLLTLGVLSSSLAWPLEHTCTSLIFSLAESCGWSSTAAPPLSSVIIGTFRTEKQLQTSALPPDWSPVTIWVSKVRKPTLVF